MDKFPTLKEIEAAHIQVALRVFKNKPADAAKALGISRGTLRNKIADYNLDCGEDIRPKAMQYAWERE